MTTADATAFRPSAYSALVIRQLLRHRDRVAGARVLDLGCGGGVLLAAARDLGAAGLCGVDIEPAALAETTRLLAEAPPGGPTADIRPGSLFGPFGGERFDMVLANLPHFPMDHAAIDTRLPSWSDGGDDGRRLLDPVIAGLGDHLAPGGMALVAHNAFVGLPATRALARDHGLEARVIDGMTVPIAREKLTHMTPAVLTREMGATLHQFGGHVFAEVLVLRIARPGDLPDPADGARARPPMDHPG